MTTQLASSAMCHVPIKPWRLFTTRDATWEDEGWTSRQSFTLSLLGQNITGLPLQRRGKKGRYCWPYRLPGSFFFVTWLDWERLLQSNTLILTKFTSEGSPAGLAILKVHLFFCQIGSLFNAFLCVWHKCNRSHHLRTLRVWEQQSLKES